MKKSPKIVQPQEDRLDAPSLSLDAQVPPESPFAGLVPSGDVEADCKEEFDILESSFSRRMRKEKNRAKAATDSDYYGVIVFQSEAQKLALFEALGWLEAGIGGTKYYDGVKLANSLGIKLPPCEVKFIEEKQDIRLNEISMPF
jgi:hypothetical protein